jgi:hypothetical protein
MEEQVAEAIVENNESVETTDSNESLSDNLAADLFPKNNEITEESEEDSELLAEETEETTETSEESKETEEVSTRQPPKSWTKEMQAKFTSLTPDVQDYIELREKQMAEGLEKDRGDANLGRVMRDTMSPYRAMLQAQGVDEVKAVQSLMNVHYRLTNMSLSDKTAYLAQIAQGYGIDLSNIPKTENEQIDPQIKALKQELDGIKQNLTQSQQNAISQAKERVQKDVETFASDPKHAYFDEIADDIAAQIQAGHDLETAYEKAVWANPVTRQKEMARLQTEQEASLREKAIAEAEKAKKASSINVKSRDTSKVPTGPKATMKDLDSVLRESMREINSKIH